MHAPLNSFSILMVALAAACSQPVSPTTPTSIAASGPTATTAAQRRETIATRITHAQSATELPFRGSFTLESAATFNCPPTCPPTILLVNGHEEGTATHLGRFTATSVDVVDAATVTSTGTFDFTAANGDRLFTTTAGREDQVIPPNVTHVTLVATIVGGTGQFAGATGTFTIEWLQTIDFVAATASGSGSLEGHISLNK